MADNRKRPPISPFEEGISFGDENYRIKRKPKPEKINPEPNTHDPRAMNIETLEKSLSSNKIFLKVPEMNINKMYDQIRDMGYQDNKLYQTLAYAINNTNKMLTNKQTHMKKKWYHLKTANLGEKEYRIKEKALQHNEVEEIKEIKEDLLKKLSSLNLPGFQSKEDLMTQLVAKKQDLMAEEISSKVGGSGLGNFDFEERSLLIHEKNQMTLLEKLLAADYSSQDVVRGVIKADAMGNLPPDNLLPMQRKKPVNLPNVARREKKASLIKLSKYIRTELETSHREEETAEQLAQNPHLIKKEDCLSISTEELSKINATKSNKTYYNESEIRESFDETKLFLNELKKKHNFSTEDLDDQSLGKLVDAVSFCLNGVHYYKKMKKTESMVHPIDILYILSKFK